MRIHNLINPNSFEPIFIDLVLTIHIYIIIICACKPGEIQPEKMGGEDQRD